MKLTRVIALAVIAASCGLGIAQAKSLRDSGTPAEFPPSSYTGRQYVDSEGCVYVRAGIDGNVTWVPRVSRARKTMCGQQPSLTARAPASATQPQTAPQPKAKVMAAPAPKRVVRAQPALAQPAQKVRVRKVAVPRRAAPVLAPAAKPAKQPVRRKTRVAAAPVCPGASALSSRYTRNSEGYAVRCGPQTAPHVTRVPGTHAARSAPRAMPAPSYEAPAYSSVPAPAAVPAYVVRTAPAAPQGRTVKRIVRVDPYTVRVAPRHVAQKQARATQEVVIPEGYKRVWMDGRLNPNRAHQTFAGKTQMDMMWTQTVPRRLILTDTGREMSEHYPGLVYPYTSYEQQRAAMRAPKRRVIVSTKSRQPAAQVSAQNYVQAGVFTTRSQAQQAAQRLTGVGLPARLGSMTQGGTKYSLLLSGPYANARAAQGALARVRGAGFGNARLR